MNDICSRSLVATFGNQAKLNLGTFHIASVNRLAAFAYLGSEGRPPYAIPLAAD